MHNHPLTTIRGWLFLLLIATTASFLVVGALGTLNNRLGSRALSSLYKDRVVPLRYLKLLSESYGSRVQDALEQMNSGEITSTEGLQIIGAARDSIQVCWRMLQEIPHSPAEERIMLRLEISMHSADMEIEGLLRFLEIQQAQGNGLLANQIGMLAGGLSTTARPVVSDLDSLSILHLEDARKDYLEADKRTGLLYAITLVILAIVILSGLAIGFRTLGRMHKQLDTILPALGRLGRGELKTRIHLDSPDELGRIAQGIDDMTASLQEIVRQMGSDACVLDTTSRELVEISQDVLNSARENAIRTKEAALEARDAATKLELSLTSLDRMSQLPGFPAEAYSTVKDALLSLRNDNMVAIVKLLSELRASSVASARGVDHLKHRAQTLEQMAEALDRRLTPFRV